MGRVMQLASFSLAEVTYATGDISYLVQEQAKSASFKVKAKQENVSGVVLPAFEVDRVPGTGASLCSTRQHPGLIAVYPHIRRLQSHWSGPWWPAGPKIEGGLCQSRRNLGGTRFVTDGLYDPRRSYPRYEPTSQCYRACRHSTTREHDQIHYERTRRDGSRGILPVRYVARHAIHDTKFLPRRLKKVQGKKKRDAETADRQKKALEEGQSEEVPDGTIEQAGGGGDLLSSKDEDVIF